LRTGGSARWLAGWWAGGLVESMFGGLKSQRLSAVGLTIVKRIKEGERNSNMGTITKKELVERITDKTKVKRHDVKRVCQELLDQVIIELRKGNRLEFRDFGVFEVKERAARVAQNPKTMEKVEVAAKRAVKFKVGRLMRESVEMGIPQPRVVVTSEAKKARETEAAANV
jgi:integration host factor subunit beta